MEKESFYDKLYHRLDKVDNIGFNYKDKLFEKTISKSILGNTKRKDSLNVIEKIIYECIESVKRIKVHRNWVWDKNYRNFN